MKYAYWALLLMPQLPLFFIGRILSPIACLFATPKVRTDVVKRLGKQTVTLMREDLPDWLAWFRTHDNDAAEWWYGMYNTTFPIKSVREWTQSDYDGSWLIRYFCRVCWYQRNNLYTFNRKFFGIAKDSPMAWQYKGASFIKGRTSNIGWKSHKGFDGLMFAGRFF